MKSETITKNVYRIITFLLIIPLILFVLHVYENNCNLYEKLNSEKKVNLLIVGDSIGAGQGSENYFWGDLFKEYLANTYNVNVNLDNISIGGTTSFCGYTILKLFKRYAHYDLVIICYGHNDYNKNFEAIYESLVNLIEERCPKCKIISILEASKFQNNDFYKQKMNTIKNIASKHKIIVADTISAFSKNPHSFENLTDEYDIHPNDNGQIIYFTALKNAFENDLDKSQKFLSLKKIKFYKISKFKQNDNLTYEIKIHKKSAYLGIDYIYHRGEKLCEIYVDNKKVFTMETDKNFPENFKHRRITDVTFDTVKINKSIKLKFKDKEEIKFFNGLIVTSP